METYNILMIAPTPFFADRGCHVQIYEEIKSLQKLGCNVTICTYHNGRNLPNLKIERIMNILWYNKLEAGPSLHKIYLDFLLFIKSLRIALKIKPDIIHGHLHEGALIGFFVGKFTKTPLLFDSQGSLTGEVKSHNFLNGNKLFHRFMYLLEKRINNLADIIVTQSTDMVNELKEKFGIPESRVFLTLDGVDTDEFRPGLETMDLREELSIPSDKKIVVYLGLLNGYQGVDCLLKAIPIVLEKKSDVHFLIMGYPNVDRYKKMADDLGILDSITFTGRVDYKDAARYILLGDIAVSPKLSKTEANGKVYNYMACGLPVVVFDTPVNREILGDLGIYAKVLGDPESLASAILQIANDDELAENLGTASRKRVVENFSWDNVAMRLISCYKMMIKCRKIDN
ncbi:MAG: glycosyltransferase family 4 protein [Candidatus Altiarchaeota archaeon]|nr:glycosyltransferase family 4 protein [Candidatus Altiarchaeota archaeon]